MSRGITLLITGRGCFRSSALNGYTLYLISFLIFRCKRPVIVWCDLPAFAAVECRDHVLVEVSIIISTHFVFDSTMLTLKNCPEVPSVLRQYSFNFHNNLLCKWCITLKFSGLLSRPQTDIIVFGPLKLFVVPQVHQFFFV